MYVFHSMQFIYCSNNLFLVAEDQYHEIIGATDAWLVADEDDENTQVSHVRSTNSARRIKALVEQVTG